MTPKKQLAFSSLITLSVLACALAVSLLTTPAAVAKPHPPTQHCDASNVGSFALTGGGFSIPQCPEGMYTLWQCSENADGSYSWDYQGRHCGPIVSVGF